MVDILLLLSLLMYREVPVEDAKTLVCIAQHESGLRPHVINHKRNRNKTKDYGLFQINSIWLKECDFTAKEILQVSNNVKCAVHVYSKQGLDAWVTYKYCQRSS